MSENGESRVRTGASLHRMPTPPAALPAAQLLEHLLTPTSPTPDVFRIPYSVLHINLFNTQYAIWHTPSRLTSSLFHAPFMPEHPFPPYTP